MVLAKKPAPPSSPSRTAAARAVAAASESVAVACGSPRRDTIEKPHLVGARPSLPLELVTGREEVTAEEVTAAVLPHRIALENRSCSRWRTPLQLPNPIPLQFGFQPWFVYAGFLAEDDAYLVKQIGQSFQYSKIEARREEQIQAAHDEAMFGALALPPPTSTDSEPEKENEKEVDKKSCCYKPLK
ncbi:uncharacterized protein DS421_14g466400 [Arachis hypogaea]|nr:uncharacterized protein DS421_14g466400 [Arachis hypogaea]